MRNYVNYIEIKRPIIFGVYL